MKAKKLLAVILCVVMFFSCCPMTSFAVCADGEHSFEWITTMQTCNADGKYEHKCSVCGYVDYTEVIPAHNYSVIYTGKVATCTETGSQTLYCSWCHSLKNEVTAVDSTNHSYGEWIIDRESTCKTPGEMHRICLRCNVTETMGISVNYLKHIADEDGWTIVTEPTCYAHGTKSAVCAECSASFTADIDIHYDYENTEKYTVIESFDGNCTTAPYTKYNCKSCLTSFTVTGEKDTAAHDFSDESKWEYLEGATCQTEGTVIKHCAHTYAHTMEDTYYADHDFSGDEELITAPTCTADGLKSVKCVNCTATTEVTVPAQHSYGDWVLNGTCQYGGTATRTCTASGCTASETVTFEAGTHLNSVVLQDVKPTCKYLGYQWIYCSDCDEQLQIFPEEYAALGHTSGPWVTETAATCNSSGLEQRVCLTCGEVLAENVLVQLNHSCIILESGTAATCTTAGTTDHTYCTLCKMEFKSETIPATGHTFVEQNYNGSESALFCTSCYEYKVNDSDETCKCMCHNSDGLAKSLFRFVAFFFKLFGIKQLCNCGAVHYEDTSIFEDVFNR